MVFRLAQTFGNPATGSNAQRGFPAPGSGAQTTGGPSQPRESGINYAPVYQTKGRRTWTDPGSPDGEQRGFGAALSWLQRRPKGSMPARQAPYGEALPVETPYYSRGAAAFVQNYGKVLTNPIGAGIVANHRPMASYGGAAQYADGAIWWTSQAVPTTINMQGLTDPATLAEVIDPIYLEAMVRTTG